MARQPKIRILVIDDDEDICAYLQTFLTREGYKVTPVCQPMEALPEVREGRHQIILLDLRMPGLDGVSLLRAIRSIDSDVCVIIMTAFPSVETAVDTMKADAFDYLPKPFEASELRAVVQRAIREKGLIVDPEERMNLIIGGKLRNLRSGRGLTLRQVANKTRLSVSLISQIELGKSAASVSTLGKLAGALGVKMAEIFEGV